MSEGDDERPPEPPGAAPEESGSGDRPPARRRRTAERKQVLLRLDPLVHDALARWAGEELRSANAQIEFLLRRALAEAGRLPKGTGPMPRRGRPRGE
ncbi:hypothetical protein [Streptomyces fragilis]|uniref:Toxin-antitoxin system HicB family antitoxin n=1 Tax=Streptomyces fragilis TaxID=67301 RepID=A0ABV2YEP7_9ACTN|nr:hypothetical protein [Streptomyces fragilis]